MPWWDWHYLFYFFLLLWGVFWYLAHYHWGWFGASGLYERASDAAQDGDTEKLLCLMRRLLKKQGGDSLRTLAGSLVWEACEWEHPDTAEAVLCTFELKRGDLMLEEKGQTALPMLEYLRPEPETWYRTIAFLEQEKE